LVTAKKGWKKMRHRELSRIRKLKKNAYILFSFRAFFFLVAKFSLSSALKKTKVRKESEKKRRERRNKKKDKKKEKERERERKRKRGKDGR
jgi:hypothetical protein